MGKLLKKFWDLISNADTAKSLWDQRSLIGSIALTVLTVFWAWVQEQPTSILFVVGMTVFALAYFFTALPKLLKKIKQLEESEDDVALSFEGLGSSNPSPSMHVINTVMPTRSDEGEFYERPYHFYFLMVEHICVTSTVDTKRTYDASCKINFADGTEVTLSGKKPDPIKKLFGFDFIEKTPNLHGYEYHFSPLTFEPFETKSGLLLFNHGAIQEYNLEGAEVELLFKSLSTKIIYTYKFEKTLKNPEPIPEDVEKDLRARAAKRKGKDK